MEIMGKMLLFRMEFWRLELNMGLVSIDFWVKCKGDLVFKF